MHAEVGRRGDRVKGVIVPVEAGRRGDRQPTLKRTVSNKNLRVG